MIETIIDEVCVECGHSVGTHFQDVIGKVRCLAVKLTNSRMTGEADLWPCSCVDYALTDKYEIQRRDERQAAAKQRERL